ncbi:hypothetical protein T440DRAFT_549859 [Plenodomus tracheiphilus IPT5]|uniref:DUF6594 domain-containing protein n=1 Tax=Plenodomus tracheiphilus IPT5 TaxID=1408161 RepID=A0A6A7BPE6_9PLEO|nr:hypothetical protein T440DRAFT_549859 [Plenodomus tracheiphilus IPT5]
MAQSTSISPSIVPRLTPKAGDRNMTQEAKTQIRPSKGFPGLANWIARDPDNESFIFRKFKALSARNLLHLQAELIILESEINELDQEALDGSDSDKVASIMRYETLLERAQDKANMNEFERRLMKKLRVLKVRIKEYHEALCLQLQVNSMSSPRQRPRDALRVYLQGPLMKPHGETESRTLPRIHGGTYDILEETFQDDLVALVKSIEDDYLSRLLQDHWSPGSSNYAFVSEHDLSDQTRIFRNTKIIRTVAILNMIMAGILLIGAIVHLHFVVNANVKLGLVAMYTMFFASSMVLCTNARRAETFAATATYAAVLVVFVSGDLSSTSNG